MKLNIQLFADTEVSIKFNNKVTGEKKLKDYAENLKIINSILKGIDTDKTRAIDSVSKDINQVADSSKMIGGSLKNVFNLGKITAFAASIKKLGAVISSTTKQSFDFLENFNLFQVAFNGNYQSAERFINKMSEMYNLDESWLTRTVGNFKQLTNAMNLTAESGEKVATLLTQMSLDISSLYNVDIDRAAETLRSAMAGQTKPIRGVTGGDITQATLQTTLDNLGIDNTVNKLSYAEKRLLIIISLTHQLNASIGDMGRTIESPANQLRIMNEQWERLTRAVGNVFLPILSQILPYLNAILMVLVEIISAIATLVGYKMDDFDYFDAAATGAWDLDEGLSSAGASAKKLKQGLRGFDKLNVITTPKAGGSGGGAGGGLGIDPKIMEAFNKAFDDYQKKLKDVQTKATRIRDKILEWLGFTKQIDEETGDVSFKYTGTNKILSSILTSLKSAVPAFDMFFKAFNGAKEIIKTLKNLTSSSIEDVSKLDGLSDKTLKRLQPIEKEFNNLKSVISSISYDGLALTEDEKQKIVGSIDDLTNRLKEALNNYVNEQIENLNFLYKETGVIDEAEYNKRLAELGKFHKEQSKKIDEQGNELKKQYSTIYDENGDIIIENYAEYLDLLDKYENDSYVSLAGGETEKSKLLEKNLDENKTNQAKYYSELLQGYAKDRDDSIKKAEEKRDKTIQIAEEQYGKMSEEYDKIKKQAEKTYDEEVKTAQEKYDEIYDAFDSSQTDIADYIDKDTGKVKSKWSKFISDLKNAFTGGIKLKVSYETNVSDTKKAIYKALGLDGFPKLSFSSYATGGLPPVGQLFVANEKGPELVGQIGGQSFVANQNQMMNLLDKKISGGGSPINATFVIQVGNKEIAKQVINDLQGMAKSNGKPITIGG